MNLDESLREILDKTFAYGIDWTEYKDKSDHDHEVSTFAGKIKDELKEALIAKIKALVVESIGQDEEYIGLSNANDIQKLMQRNGLRAEIRTKWE